METNISNSLLKKDNVLREMRLGDYKKLFNIIIDKTIEHISIKPSSKYLLFPMMKYGRSKFFDELECSKYVIERLDKRGLYGKYDEIKKEFTVSWDQDLIKMNELSKKSVIREEEIKPLPTNKIRLKLDMSIPMHKLAYLNWRSRQK